MKTTGTAGVHSNVRTYGMGPGPIDDGGVTTPSPLPSGFAVRRMGTYFFLAKAGSGTFLPDDLFNTANLGQQQMPGDTPAGPYDWSVAEDGLNVMVRPINKGIDTAGVTIISRDVML